MVFLLFWVVNLIQLRASRAVKYSEIYIFDNPQNWISCNSNWFCRIIQHFSSSGKHLSCWQCLLSAKVQELTTCVHMTLMILNFRFSKCCNFTQLRICPYLNAKHFSMGFILWTILVLEEKWYFLQPELPPIPEQQMEVHNRIEALRGFLHLWPTPWTFFFFCHGSPFHRGPAPLAYWNWCAAVT